MFFFVWRFLNNIPVSAIRLNVQSKWTRKQSACVTDSCIWQWSSLKVCVVLAFFFFKKDVSGGKKTFVSCRVALSIQIQKWKTWCLYCSDSLRTCRQTSQHAPGPHRYKSVGIHFISRLVFFYMRYFLRCFNCSTISLLQCTYSRVIPPIVHVKVCLQLLESTVAVWKRVVGWFYQSMQCGSRGRMLW